MGEIFWVCCMAGWQHMKMTAFRVFSKSFLKYLKCFYQKEYFRGQICLPEFENYMIQTNTWKHYLVPLKHVQFLCQLKTLKKWQQECVLKNSKHFIYFHKQLATSMQCLPIWKKRLAQNLHFYPKQDLLFQSGHGKLKEVQSVLFLEAIS